MPLFYVFHKKKVNRSAITIYFFICKLDELKAYTHNVYQDVTYKNALVIPLFMLVTKNDNPFMFAKSKQKIQEKDEDYSPNKKKRKKQKRFIFELFNIFDIHLEVNYALRLIIIDFITNGLVNIQENVTRILTTENTRVIMIVNCC